MDFTLTEEQELLRDTAPSAARDGVPDRRWCARTSTTVGGRGPAVGHLARVHRARRRLRRVDLCLFLEELGVRRRAGAVLRDRRSARAAAARSDRLATSSSAVLDRRRRPAPSPSPAPTGDLGARTTGRSRRFVPDADRSTTS